MKIIDLQNHKLEFFFRFFLLKLFYQQTNKLFTQTFHKYN